MLGSHDRACGSVWTRGEHRPFRPGDILLANAGDVQKTLPAERPSAYFTIFWEPQAFERATLEAGIDEPAHWSRTFLAAGQVSRQLATVHELLECGADAKAIEAAFRCATRALLRAAARGRDSLRTRCHPGVRRAALYASESLNEARPLEQMAREVQMSKCHLVRCFQSALGVPPHRYRTLLRLARARRLLESGLSVAEVASQTGFSDAPHLTRSFRDWLGVSPAAWGNAWRASDPWSEHRPRTIPPPVSR